MSSSPASAKSFLSHGMHQIRLFFIALQFYTRIPIPRWVGFEASWLAQASRYLPLVGLIVGGLAAGVYWASSWLWPHSVAVLLSMAAGIWVTGAFHEDGLADTCDGFGGGATRERTLEIMKDSRIGSYGAIGVTLLLALKATALAHMPVSAVVAALLVAHPLSRLGALALVWRLEYAREAGKAKALAENLSTTGFYIAVATGMAVSLVILTTGGISALPMLAGIASVMVAAWWMGRVFVRRIGGYTGDCLGAVQQVGELAFYLAVLAFL